MEQARPVNASGKACQSLASYPIYRQPSGQGLDHAGFPIGQLQRNRPLRLSSKNRSHAPHDPPQDRSQLPPPTVMLDFCHRAAAPPVPAPPPRSRPEVKITFRHSAPQRSRNAAHAQLSTQCFWPRALRASYDDGIATRPSPRSIASALRGAAVWVAL